MCDQKASINITEGDIVRLKPEYRTDGERKYLFKVSDINTGTGRCTITCINSTLPIAPSEIVEIKMIKRV